MTTPRTATEVATMIGTATVSNDSQSMVEVRPVPHEVTEAQRLAEDMVMVPRSTLEQMFLRLGLHMPSELMSTLASMGTAASTAAPGPSYLEQIHATPMEYHPHIIEALKTFKRNHRLGNESNEARLAGMQVLLEEISSAQRITAPELIMRNIDGSDSGDSNYNPADHRITMLGKLSIITFLHEIGHAVFQYDEHMARVWSIKLFKKVYPKAYARLEVHNGFVLKMPEHRVAVPVVASGPAEGEVTP